MNDPSQGIQRELQAHVHLLSTYRFPQLPALHADKVAEWLLNAPKIARDQAPFYWTYLDRPVDGTILLVWQSPSLGAEFPSDGYVWAPNETAFQLDVGGYVLEMYHQKVGFSPGEPLATHTRRRYRLHPSRNPNHQGINPDPCLWIVHYSQSDPNDRVPSNVIPIDMRITQTINVRQHLQAQGQIVQKDFMLHDRTNWPSIAFPRGRPQGQQPMYGATVPPARVPQAMAYPPQHQQGPPAKRPRPNTSASTATVNSPAALLEVDDEEDTSRGDIFDHVTPREISVARYKQNHEWMEEILSSPYAMNQIIPADLGLGLRGELASLTAEIFDAPFDPDKDAGKYNYVGRLDSGKAEEFRKRTAERIEKENKEIERLKARHARRMARLKQGTVISFAEKELRTAVNNPDDTGPDFWRLEGRIDEESNEDDMAVKPTRARVSDIVAKVEASLGRHVQQVKELVRIQAGGFEEAPAIPSPQAPAAPTSNSDSNTSGILVEDADMEMGNSAGGLLDQFHTGLSSQATPGSNNFPTPQAQIHSAVGTPGVNTASPAAAALQQDTSISGDGAQNQNAAQGTGADDNTSGGGAISDWIVVPPGGKSPSPSANTTATAQTTTTTTTTAAPPAQALGAPSPAVLQTLSAVNTPGGIGQGTSASTPLPDFHTSPNDFADLGDLDGADGYGGDLDEVGDFDGADGDGGMGMDMDDSAFGDAFHASNSGDGADGDGDDDGDGL